MSEFKLNEDAWSQWVAYRSGIKKPIKSVSEEAMKLKLMRMGNLEQQQAIVDQSIANQWQGLFELKQGKPDVSAKKTRTKEEVSADQANFEYMQRESAKAWDRSLQSECGTGLVKIRLAEALLSRYDTEQDQGSAILNEKRGWLKTRVVELLRETAPGAVLADYTCWRLVLRLFGDKGLLRLEQRARG
jgi:hypothetical protein